MTFGPCFGKLASRPFSLDVPSRRGPRNCGQSSARAWAAAMINRVADRRECFMRCVPCGLPPEIAALILGLDDSLFVLEAAEADGAALVLGVGMVPVSAPLHVRRVGVGAAAQHAVLAVAGGAGATVGGGILVIGMPG